MLMLYAFAVDHGFQVLYHFTSEILIVDSSAAENERLSYQAM